MDRNGPFPRVSLKHPIFKSFNNLIASTRVMDQVRPGTVPAGMPFSPAGRSRRIDRSGGRGSPGGF